MLNFLNTAVLALAAAALFPFLLHLFSRRKVKIIPFSSITFLKAMQKRQVRSIKIRQILLLIIRTLIILALVLAFARPATLGGYLGSHASVSAIILIDNSASMGTTVKDGRLFELALGKAEEILSNMGQADEAAVMTTGGGFFAQSSDNLFGNPQAAAAVLEKIDLSDDRADLAADINQAAKILDERMNLNRELYIISDLQDNSLDPAALAAEFRARPIFVNLPGDQIDNVGITEVDFGNQLLEVGTEFAVTAMIERYSGSEEETLISIYLDGRRAGQRGERLKSNTSLSVSFNLVVNEPGFHSGSISLSDDNLLADNAYYFTFYIPEEFNILLVGNNAMAARMVKLALAPDEDVRRHWSVHQANYDQIASINLNEYDAILLTNYSSLPGGDLARIKEYIRRGGGLLVSVGQGVDSAHFNQQLSEVTGISLASSFPSRFSRSGYYSMIDFDYEHQILSVLQPSDDESGFNIKTFALAKSKLTADSPARILARWSDGSPAISVAEYNRGRVMYLNCDISPDISDFSLHPVFVPFMVRSAEYLSASFSEYAESVLAGSTPTRILRGKFPAADEYILITPDDSRRIVDGQFQDNERLAVCNRVDRAGIYSIRSGAREVDRFAVNIDPVEGDLYRFDWDDLKEYFPKGDQLPYQTALAGWLNEKRFGRELWQYFLVAALLFLLLEMYVARDRGAVDTDRK